MWGIRRQNRLRKGQLLAIILVLATVVAGCGGRTVSETPAPPAAASPSPAPLATLTPTPRPDAVLSPTTTPPALGPGAIAARFDEKRAMEHVRTLAQPQFMGRHTGTPGEILGAQYLADQFQRFGLKPGAKNGAYLQEFPMKVTELSQVPELILVDEAGRERPLALRDDFRPLVGGQAGPGAAEGPGVFAGTGDFSNIDVRGAVALVVPRARNLIGNARDAGAVGLILTTGEETLLKGELLEPDSSATLPVLLVNVQGAETLLEGSGHNREELNQKLRAGEPIQPFPLAFRIRMNVEADTFPVQARNVVAFLPAASPTEESCIVGAHYEEIGPDPDGVVFPAANDNASGTAVMLEMARLMAEQQVPLRANVIFLGWSGHEEGLLGSAHYVDNPVFPLDQAKCYINLDTVGQGSGQQLRAASSDTRLRSLMEEALGQVEAVTGRRPPVLVSQESSGASDHINFIRRGVPALDLSWMGILEGGKIHVPEDTADNVDPERLKVTGQAATAALLALTSQPR